MMHNSLLILDRLEAANNEPYNRLRRDPHRHAIKLERSVTKLLDVNYLEGQWSVVLDGKLEGMEETAIDLKDYMQRIGVDIASNASNFFILREDSAVAAGSFCRDVKENAIILSASDISGLWASIVYLEKEISSLGSLALPIGRIERTPSWKKQISQAPYGANYLVPNLDDTYLSDDAFRLLVHYGINGMIIYGDWLLYVNNARYFELNHPHYDRNIAILKTAAKRAKKFGISLYFVAVSPKLAGNHPIFSRIPSMKGAKISPGLKETTKEIYNLCSSDHDSLNFHGETMAGLFREVPDLGGLILIIGGESYYHCFMRPDMMHIDANLKTNCMRCQTKTPEEAVNALLAATATAVHKEKPEASVMAWPYSAFIWSSDPAQVELLESLPKDVALLSTIEKDELYWKNGYKKRIWDYSIDFVGPAGNLLKQAEVVQKRGIPLYIKTETAIGLECIHIPYMPALHKLGYKWEQVSLMKADGVVQSWMFFGMWGSRAEELGWWKNWKPDLAIDEILNIMANRDFGEDALSYIRAWSYMSEAASHFPYIPIYFTGPEFIGPAHPLVFDEEFEQKPYFEARLYYLQENEETFSTAVNEVKHSLALTKLPYSHMNSSMIADKGKDLVQLVISEYELACDYAKAAFKEIQTLTYPMELRSRNFAREEHVIIEFVYRSLLTTLHTYKFLLAKEQSDRELMMEIARLELANTERALALIAEAPWLDLNRRTDGDFPSSKVMMQVKINSLNKELAAR
ncbi:hypothetical protein [Paenibacillus sp. GXUN7292]|uniref:hypothetical protein n=1 Tax=Paenibacillus sp. GXUN7292 TaxID=3422499 RepID=UPI003D7E6BA6